jgi:hypothetical protein
MLEKIKLFPDKIKKIIGKQTISRIMFFALGIASTIWFLIRVIPKPQRATYPCMRAAAPLMSTFVIYLLTLSGSVMASRKAKIHLLRARYLYSGLFFTIAIASAFLFFARRTEDVSASGVDTNSLISNSPIGVEHGIFPGRVVWVFDPEVAKWDGSNMYWWDDMSTSQVEADYLINLALLKGHIGQGVTLCAKNLYGATSIDRNWRNNAHDNFNQDKGGKDKYMTFTDFMGHKDLGGKTLLFIIDALYGARSQYGPPLLKDKWRMEPFNNRWCSSLFASQDGVAVDAVGIDFLRSEWPDLADIAYTEKYLVEAALADNPPSKTVYDPERDGTGLKSLGVLEHWNNAIEKKYSRNLGRNYGIELVYVPINAK